MVLVWALWAVCQRTVWPCSSLMYWCHKAHSQAHHLPLPCILLHGLGRPCQLLPGKGTCLVNCIHLVAGSLITVLFVPWIMSSLVPC